MAGLFYSTKSQLGCWFTLSIHSFSEPFILSGVAGGFSRDQVILMMLDIQMGDKEWKWKYKMKIQENYFLCPEVALPSFFMVFWWSEYKPFDLTWIPQNGPKHLWMQKCHPSTQCNAKIILFYRNFPTVASVVCFQLWLSPCVQWDVLIGETRVKCPVDKCWKLACNAITLITFRKHHSKHKY